MNNKENEIKKRMALLEEALSVPALKRYGADDPSDIGDYEYYIRNNVKKRLSLLIKYAKKFNIESLSQSDSEQLTKVDVVKNGRIWHHPEFDEAFDEDFSDLNENDFTKKHPGLEPTGKIDRTVEVKSAVDVVNGLERDMNLPEWTFKAAHPNGVDIIRISEAYSFDCSPFSSIIPMKEREMFSKDVESLKTVDSYCLKNGYYRASTALKYDRRTGGYFAIAVYNPVRDVPISKMLKHPIYHCTSVDNYDSISENGLIPANGYRTYDYLDDKIFFYAGTDIEGEDFAKMMNGVVSGWSRRGKNTDVDVYRLMASKTRSLDLYYDVNRKDCVYCKESIPRNWLYLEFTADFTVTPPVFEERHDD